MEKTLRIGGLTLKNRYILGPMAGVSDMPFRRLCHQYGAGLVCSEMVSCKGIYYQNKNTRDLLTIDEEEHPVSLQLFGSDPEIIKKSIALIEEVPYDILDFNMGCPVPKVVNNGEGSALMKNSKLVYEIVKSMVASTKKPVTVKIRKGFDHANAVEIGKVIEQAGASAIIVHGRTREEYYSGKVDYGIIKEVKEAVSIPVIGSGDVVDVATCRKMEETGCDGIMIARGARGNPWIFKELLAARDQKEYVPPTPGEWAGVILEHAKGLVAFKGEESAIREMRKHVGWYSAGMAHSASLRREINEITTYQEFEEKIMSLV